MKLLIALCLSFALTLQAATTKILSLDGGGVRGVVSLEILRNLEKETGLKCHEDFDIYAGTSTGSIIACMLACGISVDQIAEQYEKLSEDIFTATSYGVFSPKYDSTKLKAAIHNFMKAEGLTLDLKLKDIEKKLVIPTVMLTDPTTSRPKMELITNIQAQCGEVKLIDAILKSTAAPTYFLPHEGHVDGGVAMNDPSLVAIFLAQKAGMSDFSKCTLLSVGTGFTKSFFDLNESWGVLGWAWTGASASGNIPILDLILDVQQQVPEQLCSQLLGSSYRKIDIFLDSGIALDAYQSIPDLTAKTERSIDADQLLWCDHAQWVRDNIVSPPYDYWSWFPFGS